MISKKITFSRNISKYLKHIRRWASNSFWALRTVDFRLEFFFAKKKSNSDNAGNSSFKRYPSHLPIRSQIQILIRHNFFQTEYFLLKFSGSSELFLKRSIPVRFCSKNCICFQKLSEKKRMLANFIWRSPHIFFERKDTGFVRLIGEI